MSELIIFRTLFKVKDLHQNMEVPNQLFFIKHPTMDNISFISIRYSENEFRIVVLKDFEYYYQYLDIAWRFTNEETYIYIGDKTINVTQIENLSDIELILTYSRDILDQNLKVKGVDFQKSQTPFMTKLEQTKIEIPI